MVFKAQFQELVTEVLYSCGLIWVATGNYAETFFTCKKTLQTIYSTVFNIYVVFEDMDRTFSP